MATPKAPTVSYGDARDAPAARPGNHSRHSGPTSHEPRATSHGDARPTQPLEPGEGLTSDAMGEGAVAPGRGARSATGPPGGEAEADAAAPAETATGGAAATTGWLLMLCTGLTPPATPPTPATAGASGVVWREP
jgi:hypothetical protein